MFKQLSNIIINSITGGHLNNSAEFLVEVLKNNGVYMAKLTPKKKELQRLYKFIEITFNNDISMVKCVKIEEKTGDTTIVELFNIKVNLQINETAFKHN
jgi:outer membrane lipoprotein-sorting protein